MTTGKLRAGVIGCGPIAERGHLPGLAKSEKAEVAAIADLDTKTLEKTARKFNVKKTFTDYQAMLDEKLDLVDVCVPNHLHARVAIDAMRRGSHVLVEKPLATSVEDAEKMVKVAEEMNVKLCEAKQWRYIPAVQKAHRIFSEGRVGKLVSMLAQWHTDIPLTWSHAQWYYDPQKSGGGIVSDIGIHMLDLLLFFGGPVRRVSASGGDYLGTMGFDTSVQALLEFSGGGTGFLDVSWLAPYSKLLDIVGTAGIVTVDMTYYSLLHANYSRNPMRDFFHDARKIMGTARRVINKDFFNSLPSLYAALINELADSIVHDKPPPIPGEMAIKALQLKEAIYKSISEKTEVQVVA
ncbi:MAG TPA: Gfo/Idh/MocA family oxidoreductase [Candidatus Angelobacter sp.]|nr:Gfo/Idh/MocA family oxidoreductase [Candidatus Angelobacter sp.]